MLPPITFAENVELRRYYEKQKTQLLRSFQPPETGKEVTIKLTTGAIHRGEMVLLTPGTVTLKMKVGPVTYSRMMLDTLTRKTLFAEDYAHYTAYDRTKALKNKQSGNPRQIGEAPTHLGRISVKASLNKENDKSVVETAKGNTEITTTTKSKTESCTLKISVANMTPSDDTYRLEWYFIKTPITEEGAVDPVLGDKDSTEIMVPGKKKIDQTVTSLDFTWAEITSERINNDADDGGGGGDARVSDSGDEYRGYVVFLKHGDEILDKKSSSKTFLTDEWLKKLKERPDPPTPLNLRKKGKKNK